MQLNPYLSFDGRCEEAFRFYAQCFGGTIGEVMTYGSSPMADKIPAECGDKVMHVRLSVGDQVLMGSDALPGHHQTPQGIYVSLSPTDPTDAERIFAALADGGNVQMPVQETFWARRFGMVTDRFGTPWMVNCE